MHIITRYPFCQTEILLNTIGAFLPGTCKGGDGVLRGIMGSAAMGDQCRHDHLSMQEDFIRRQFFSVVASAVFERQCRQRL